MSNPAAPLPSHPVPSEFKQEVESTTWLDFAAIMLGLVGTFNVVDGLSAIRDSHLIHHDQLFSNVHAWGWFFLIWGIIQLFAAVSVYRGASFGRIVGIVTAFFNAIAQLAWAGSYPVWSITILTIDVLVIYGLVHGASRRTV
jgi:hypothetical protein